MKVYFVRHGQAVSNVERIVNDVKERVVHLTDLGEKQAKKTGKKLAKKKIEIIFCSEFTRCKETANIINEFLNVKIKLDKRLNEWDTGFDGKSYDVVNDFLHGKSLDTKKPGHESSLDVKSRIIKFLTWLKKQDYDSILIVTHEQVARVLYGYYKNISDERAFKKRIKNADVYSFEL